MGRSCSGRKGNKKSASSHRSIGLLCSQVHGIIYLPQLLSCPYTTRFLGAGNIFSSPQNTIISYALSNIISCSSTVKLAIKQLLSRWWCTKSVVKYKHLNSANNWQNFQLWGGRKQQGKKKGNSLRKFSSQLQNWLFHFKLLFGICKACTNFQNLRVRFEQ